MTKLLVLLTVMLAFSFLAMFSSYMRNRKKPGYQPKKQGGQLSTNHIKRPAAELQSRYRGIVDVAVKNYDRGHLRKICKKHRVYIPSDICAMLNINDGDTVAFSVENNKVIIKKYCSTQKTEATNGER